MDFGHLAGNFLTAFTQARQQKEQNDDAKKERDAKLKLFELELKRAQSQQAAQDQQTAALEQLRSRLGTPGPSGKPPGLLDLLSDPQAGMTLLQSGLFKSSDLIDIQAQNNLRNLLGGSPVISEAGATGGSPTPGAAGAGQAPGAMPGFEVSGIKIDTSGRPMFDFARKGEVARWMPSPDGRTQIGVDRMGRPVATAPGGPGDRAPEDRPLTPGELADMRGPNGQMLPPGTTLRQAQQMGAITAPKPTESDKNKGVMLQGMESAEKILNGLTGTDSSSSFNRLLESNDVTKLLTSKDYRKYKAAAQQWSQNYVFLKSGATAGPSETQQTFEMFFPQPNDPPEVKKQKNEMRNAEMQNMRSQYGQGGAGGAGGKVIDFSQLPP